MAISILSLKSVNDLFAPTLICQVIIELLMPPYLIVAVIRRCSVRIRIEDHIHSPSIMSSLSLGTDMCLLDGASSLWPIQSTRAPHHLPRRQQSLPCHPYSRSSSRSSHHNNILVSTFPRGSVQPCSTPQCGRHTSQKCARRDPVLLSAFFAQTSPNSSHQQH